MKSYLSSLSLLLLLCVMEDAMGNIQETGQEQRPARMVGLSSLDSSRNCKEAVDNKKDGSCGQGMTKLTLSSPSLRASVKTSSAHFARVSPANSIPVIDRSKIDPRTLAAAEGMETMFLNYMMHVMRQSVPKNALELDSPAVEIYRDMLDSEYAKKAASRGGIGLADQIIAYLQSRGYNQSQRQVSPKITRAQKGETMRVNQTGSSPIQNSETKKATGTQAKEKITSTPNSGETSQTKNIDTSGVKADISAKSKEFSQAKAVASQSPDIREDKIAELKKRIEEKKYNVRPEAIADKLVDDHMRLHEPA